jgi:hypothetical protein
MHNSNKLVDSKIATINKSEKCTVKSENQYSLSLKNSREDNKESIEKYLENIIKP